MSKIQVQKAKQNILKQGSLYLCYMQIKILSKKPFIVKKQAKLTQYFILKINNSIKLVKGW